MPAKKTNISKGTNPLAMLKAVQKKKTNIRKKKEVKAAEVAAKIQKEKGWQEAKEANRGSVLVGKDTAVNTPIYCKVGKDKDFSARVRCGAPLVGAIQERAEEKGECDNDFLMSLLRVRLDHIEQHVVRVYNYYPQSDNQFTHMNMPEHISKPCLSLMGRFDFTYGTMTTCNDVIDSTSCITTLNPIESQDGKDFVSQAFCLVYQLFLLRTSSKTCLKLLKRHVDKPYAVAIILMYLRYTYPPTDFVRAMARQLVTTDDDNQVVVGEGKTVTMAVFADMLLSSDSTDEFYQVFPPFSEEEDKFVKSYASKIKENFKILSPEEEIANKKKLLAERKTAQEEREKMIHKMKNTTLLHGFTDATTLMNWASYRAAVEGHTTEAVSTEMVKKRLLTEREKFEEAQRHAAELRQQREAAEAAAAATLKQKKADQRKKQSQPSPADEHDTKRTKTEKPKLQQVQDSYLY